MPAPPWYPHRVDVRYTQPGNPALGPDGDLSFPGWNPGGLNPGAMYPLGMSKWEADQSQLFQSDGTNQVWTWQTPVFDLRPEWKTNDSQLTSGFPVNHAGLMGLNVYINFLLTNAGGVAPALLNSLTATYVEHVSLINTEQMFQMHPDVDISDTIRAGGTSITPPYGGSLFQIYAPVGVRFWRVSITLTIEGVAAVTEALRWQAASN